MTATATLMPNGRKQFFSASGAPLAGGFVYYYIPSTTTLKTTWLDSGQVTANTNPIILDAAGTCLVYGSGVYREYVTDSLANLVQDALTSDTEPSTETLTGIVFTNGSPVVSSDTVLSAIGKLQAQVTDYANIAALRLFAGTPPASVYVLGYYTAGDGAQGEFVYVASDTTSADNAGTIIVDASGHRWYRDQEFSQGVDVRWFGAKVNGSTDDTVAFQAAIAYALTLGGTVNIPVGRMVISSVTASNAAAYFTLRGAGKEASYIVTNSTTATVLSLALAGHEIRDLTITTNVTKTAGAHISAASNIGNIFNVGLDAFFLGINGLDNAGTWRDLIFTNPASSSTAAIVNGYPVALVIDNMNTYVGTHTPAAGLVIYNVACVNMTNSDIVGYGNNLEISPGTGQAATSCYFTNCIFDSGSAGIAIAPSGSGFVARVKFTSCETNSNTGNGTYVSNPGTSIVQGIEFHNHMGSLNASGSGIAVLAGSHAPTGVSINGGTFAANAAGITIGANITDFSITGVMAGAYGGMNGNTTAGINVVSGTSDRYVISLNRTHGNTTGGVVDSGSGVNKYVGNNIT